jgi:hypothetical protein
LKKGGGAKYKGPTEQRCLLKEEKSAMTNSIPEKDWKYIRSIEKELLSELCQTINQKAAEIVHAGAGSEYDKYLLLYKHLKNADAIVADCFNDWRRSNLLFKLPLLHRHKILRDEHILNLSVETRERLGRFTAAENVWSPEIE